MALINCPECGNQISDKAKKCPKCGYKVKKGKAKIIIMSCVIAVLLVMRVVMLVVMLVVFILVGGHTISNIAQKQKDENAIVADNLITNTKDDDNEKEAQITAPIENTIEQVDEEHLKGGRLNPYSADEKISFSFYSKLDSDSDVEFEGTLKLKYLGNRMTQPSEDFEEPWRNYLYNINVVSDYSKEIYISRLLYVTFVDENFRVMSSSNFSNDIDTIIDWSEISAYSGGSLKGALCCWEINPEPKYIVIHYTRPENKDLYKLSDEFIDQSEFPDEIWIQLN